MKRFFLFFLIFSLMILPVFAAETEPEPTNTPREPGFCGADILWEFDRGTGTLTISGNGAMDDFPQGPPWQAHREDITQVVFRGNIDYVGAYSFEDYDNLTQVRFSGTLRELGKRSFYGCDGLTELTLPATFRVFGEECLRQCTSLTAIHCLGPMPSFRLNCLWETYTDIFYPEDNPWPEDPVRQVEDAFRRCFRILPETEYIAPLPTEQVPSHTSPATEPTEESTEPVEESTEATEQTTEQTTQATTEATEPSSETTAPQTQPTQPPEIPTRPQVTEPVQDDKGSGSWIGIALIAAVLSGAGLGALIFARPRKRRGRGKYSR